MATETLGVDIGNVIMGGTKVNGVHPRLPDAFEVLKKLKDKRFGHNLFLVSRANARQRHDTILWLDHHRFFQQTGISFSCLNFCEERHEKAPICVELEITHFIDDRTEVLEYLYQAGITNLYLFQGRPDEIGPRSHFLPKVRRVESWQETAREFLG